MGSITLRDPTDATELASHVATTRTLADKWWIDQEALVARLARLSPVSCLAVVATVPVFWAHAMYPQEPTPLPYPGAYWRDLIEVLVGADHIHPDMPTEPVIDCEE